MTVCFVDVLDANAGIDLTMFHCNVSGGDRYG